MLVWSNCSPILCVLMCDCPPVSPFLYSPVLAELQQAGLITNEQCEELRDPSDVFEVQRDESPEVMAKTADVLRRHEFEEQSSLLAGKQARNVIHVPVVCGTVKPNGKGHLKTSIIIVSFMCTILGAGRCRTCSCQKAGSPALIAYPQVMGRV